MSPIINQQRRQERRVAKCEKVAAAAIIQLTNNEACQQEEKEHCGGNTSEEKEESNKSPTKAAKRSITEETLQTPRIIVVASSQLPLACNQQGLRKLATVLNNCSCQSMSSWMFVPQPPHTKSLQKCPHTSQPDPAWRPNGWMTEKVPASKLIALNEQLLVIFSQNQKSSTHAPNMINMIM